MNMRSPSEPASPMNYLLHLLLLPLFCNQNLQENPIAVVVHLTSSKYVQFILV